jgi:hypothetical protein
MKLLPLIATLLVFAVGCDGCGDSKGSVDASSCTVPASFTAVTDLRLFYKVDRDTVTAGNQEEWKAIGQMDLEPTRDLLWIELFEGPAPDYTTADFPPTPFTIELTGPELDYVKCSTCISLTSNADVATLGPGKINYVDDYMATAGSVTITTLTATNIVGTLSNIKFAHVNNAASGTTLNASGCTSMLSSLSFTATTTAAMANDNVWSGGAPSSGKRPLR